MEGWGLIAIAPSSSFFFFFPLLPPFIPPFLLEAGIESRSFSHPSLNTGLTHLHVKAHVFGENFLELQTTSAEELHS